MNQEIKEKWVAALESGEYQQARKCLNDGTGFCCLGVLTDLFIKETKQGKWIPNVVEIPNGTKSFTSELTLNSVHDAQNMDVPEEKWGWYDALLDGIEESVLPTPVTEWAGLPIETHNPLMTMNDGIDLASMGMLSHQELQDPKSFLEIAQYIKENL